MHFIQMQKRPYIDLVLRKAADCFFVVRILEFVDILEIFVNTVDILVRVFLTQVFVFYLLCSVLQSLSQMGVRRKLRHCRTISY